MYLLYVTSCDGKPSQRLNPKSYRMTTPQIIWCAQSSMHYIVEGATRYAMPLYLAIQVKDYLKNCCCGKKDCVAQFISDLGPADRTLVKVIDQRELQPGQDHSPISLRTAHAADSTLRA
jgi:hypothetical protein